MKVVKIADLKSRLSRHLREVRAGATLTVLDRRTPIARLVPIGGDDGLVVTAPDPEAPSLGRVRLPSSGRTRVDVVALLLQDRRGRG